MMWGMELAEKEVCRTRFIPHGPTWTAK